MENSDFVRNFRSKKFWIKNLILGWKNSFVRKRNSEVIILMKDFEEQFSKSVVDRRRAELSSIRKAIRPGSPLSFCRLFELLFLDGVIKDNWLGKGIIASEATEFDDLRNGIDLIVTLKEQNVVFGVDITLTKKSDVVAKKLQAKRSLPAGFTNINFYSDGCVFSGKKKVPKFVIGVDNRLVKEMRKELKMEKNEIRAESFELLKRSTRERILTQVYLEILLEAETFRQSNKSCADKIAEIERVIWPLFIINIRKRIAKRMFSKEVLVKMKHKTFKGRREVILESWGLTEGDSQNRDGATDTFGVLVWALKNSFESWK